MILRALVAISLCPVLAPSASASFIPLRVPVGSLGQAPYQSAGLVEANFGRKSFSGSGAVALDRRLVFSCAHVVYDSGRWANRFAFARAYSGYLNPAPTEFSTARGYRVLEGYAANRYDDYFDYDFSVAYAGRDGDFGPALELADDVYASLTDPGSNKTVLGYPSYRDADFEPGFYLMHQTGPFDDPFTEDYGSDFSYDPPYLVIDGVSTGPGNSGGPVLIQDAGDADKWKLAGILVSGTDDSAGICSLGEQAKAAASDLLSNVVEADAYEQQITYGKTTVLRDNAARFNSIRFRVLPQGSQTVRICLYLDLATVYGDPVGPGEIEAQLRSPAGRIYPVAVDFIDATTKRIEVSGSAEVSEGGRWTLFIRDKSPGTASVLQRAVLSMTSK